jgi:hypothetical protein
MKGSVLRDRRSDFSTRTPLHEVTKVVYFVVIFFIIIIQAGFEIVLPLKVTILLFYYSHTL